MGRARSAAILSGSAVVAAALGWVTLVAVGRLEGHAVYGTVAVIWAIYYGSAGIFSGLQHEVTRTRVEADPVPDGSPGAPLVVAAGLFGVVGAGVVLASFPLWRAGLGLGWSAAVGMAIGVAGLAGLVVVLGLLAAEGRWRLMAGLLLADAAARLVGVVLVAEASGGAAAYVATVGGASWVWMPLVLSRRAGGRLRSDLTRRVDVRSFLAKSGASMLATGCASLIVAGLPWLMATVRGEVVAESAGLLAALVLFRSPVLAVANSLRPLVLRELLTGTSVAKAGVLRLWAWCAAGGVVMSALAYVGGPSCLELVFGSGFDVTRAQAAGLVASSALLAMATVATMGLMAIDAHARVVEAWMLALAVTVLVLMVSRGDDAVVAAAISGPLVAVGWIAVRGWDVRSRVKPPAGVRRVAL